MVASAEAICWLRAAGSGAGRGGRKANTSTGAAVVVGAGGAVVEVELVVGLGSVVVLGSRVVRSGEAVSPPDDEHPTRAAPDIAQAARMRRRLAIAAPA